MELATPDQFAARLDRIKARNGNNQPHPDAGNPYEQIPAAELRVGDVFVQKITDAELDVTFLDRQSNRVTVWFGKLGSFTYAIDALVTIKRRTTESVEAHELRDGDTIVNPQSGDTIPIVMVGPLDGLVFIWTTSTGGFAMSRNVTVEIARRNGGA